MDLLSGSPAIAEEMPQSAGRIAPRAVLDITRSHSINNGCLVHLRVKSKRF
jgi:hypothetical protein